MSTLNGVGIESAGSAIESIDDLPFNDQANDAVIVYLNGARGDYVVDLTEHRFEALNVVMQDELEAGASILCHCDVLTVVYLVDVPEGANLIDTVHTKFAEHQVAQFGGMV